MTTLDPAYCADGCGRLAETERPTADGRTEKVCALHAEPLDDLVGALQKAVAAARARRLGEKFVTTEQVCTGCAHSPHIEHSSNPREDG